MIKNLALIICSVITFPSGQSLMRYCSVLLGLGMSGVEIKAHCFTCLQKSIWVVQVRINGMQGVYYVGATRPYNWPNLHYNDTITECKAVHM